MLIDRIKAGHRLDYYHQIAPDATPPDPIATEEAFHRSVGEAIAFNLTPIVGHYHEYKQTKTDGFRFSRDAFAVIPPYPATWTEHVLFGDTEDRATMGTLLVTTELPDIPIFTSRSSVVMAAAAFDADPDEDVEVSGLARYVVTITRVVGLSTRIIVEHSAAQYLADAQGLPITKIMRRARHPDLDAWNRLDPMTFICFYAFNLLACKNVSEKRVKIAKQLQRARFRRKKPPLTEYRVLDIAVPVKQCVPTDSELAQTAKERIETRFHAVRGHFANYSEEKPLFGKLSGRFWIPAHVRGSKDAGEIKKDYRIIAPEAK